MPPSRNARRYLSGPGPLGYGGRPLKQLCKRVAPLSQLFTFELRSSFLKNRIHRFDMIFHLMRQSLQAR